MTGSGAKLDLNKNHHSAQPANKPPTAVPGAMIAIVLQRVSYYNISKCFICRGSI